MSPLENKCLYQAKKLHQGVIFGNGLVMLDQIIATTNLVKQFSQLTADKKEITVCASLLHKCFESKRIAPDVSPMNLNSVELLAGSAVRAIVEELSTEPEDETKSKKEQWQEKAIWARALSPEAREILLAEKVVNFKVSRDQPNSKKPLTWHKEYYETRMLMVEAIKETNPHLYQLAVKIKNEGLMKIYVMQQKSFNKENSL